MKTRTIIFTFVLVFMIPFISTAQVGNLLRNKVNRVISAGAKTLDKEIDKEIDTAATKAAQNAANKAHENAEQQQTGATGSETSVKSSGSQPSKGFNLGGLMGGKVTAKYNPSYSFNGRLYMQMEMYDKKEVVKMDYYLYFSETTLTAGFESRMVGAADDGQQVSMLSSGVFDGENKSFLLLTDMGTMKMGIISEVPDENSLPEQPAETTVKPTITRTGNSKVIAGYKCDEYLYKDNEQNGHGKLWITKDLKLKGDNRVYSKAGLPSYFGSPELEGAAVLAMESYNEKNELQMKSETKEIDMNYPHTISVEGYSLRQMNFNQAGTQKKK
jgi:hypothetical protein